MELYLFLSFVLLYVLTAFFVKKNVQHKIWTFAFIIAFVVTSLSIGFLRVNQQDVMMSASQLNWYYMLYLFGSMSVVLGAINLWMYRKPMWQICSEEPKMKRMRTKSIPTNNYHKFRFFANWRPKPFNHCQKPEEYAGLSETRAGAV